MARFAPLLVSFGAVASAACGASADNWSEGRPLISKLSYLQQLPDDPYMLAFAIEFVDSDGDLEGGMVHLYTNRNEEGQLSMRDVFQRQMPPLAASATMGELEVTVGLSHDIGEDEEVTVGFVLEDAKGNTSNDPHVVLKALAPGGG